MRFRVIALAAPLAGLLFVGCGSDPAINADGSPVPKEAPGGVDLSAETFVDLTGEDALKVDALDNNFKAPYIEVTAGVPITFRNDGRNAHNVIPVSESEFDAVEADDFEPGAETTITFDQPGEFPYYCSLHGTETKGMVGAVRVVDE